MKKSLLLVVTLIICLLQGGVAWAERHSPPALPAMTITGEVTHPLKLTVAELARFQSVEVKLNEVDRDGHFHGVYLHQAVPLRNLLDMAGIKKQDQPFEKEIDLAVRVTGAFGKQVVLSWGEIYYSNATEITLAFAAEPVRPIMPEARCQGCHGPEIYRQSLREYDRPAKMPKLLVRGDFYTDRCLEGVTRIEVIDLHFPLKVDRSATLESKGFVVTGAVEKELEFSDLQDFPRTEIWKKVVGVHRGYHGLHRFKGVSLAKVLERAGVGGELTKAVLVSAPDGYRALFSFGELFQSFAGRRILLAESVDDRLLEGQRGGKYRIIVPDELVDDRGVLAVDRIEVVDLKP